MILIKADGTVVPLGREGLVAGPPVDPNWRTLIRVAVMKKFEEEEARGLPTQGQMWSKLGPLVIGAEVPSQ
jgi:hypothetical protein